MIPWGTGIEHNTIHSYICLSNDRRLEQNKRNEEENVHVVAARIVVNGVVDTVLRKDFLNVDDVIVHFGLDLDHPSIIRATAFSLFAALDVTTGFSSCAFLRFYWIFG
jgi:hypothetical protein